MAAETNAGGDVQRGRDVDRLLDATVALARTLGSDALEPIVQAAADQARRLVDARLAAHAANYGGRRLSLRDEQGLCGAADRPALVQ